MDHQERKNQRGSHRLSSRIPGNLSGADKEKGQAGRGPSSIGKSLRKSSFVHSGAAVAQCLCAGLQVTGREMILILEHDSYLNLSC